MVLVVKRAWHRVGRNILLYFRYFLVCLNVIESSMYLSNIIVWGKKMKQLKIILA